MKLREDRRALHEIPELDRCLPETFAYLQNALAGLNCRVFSPAAGSLCAWFDFGKADAIAFRRTATPCPSPKKPGGLRLPASGANARLRPRWAYGNCVGACPAAQRKAGATPQCTAGVPERGGDHRAVPGISARPVCSGNTGYRPFSACICGRGWRPGSLPAVPGS